MAESDLQKFLKANAKSPIRPGAVNVADVGKDLPETLAPAPPSNALANFLAANRPVSQPMPAIPAPVAPTDNPPGTLLSRSLDTGAFGMQNVIASTLEGLALARGKDEWVEKMKAVQANAQRRLAEIEPYRVTIDQGKASWGGAFKLTAQSVAEQIPQLLGLGAAALTGPLAVPAGVALTSAQSYGSLREEQKAARIAEGKAPIVDEGTALLYTIPHAALDYISDRFMMKGLAPKAGQNMLTRFVKGGTEGAVTEVPTELAQTVIERFQAGEDLTSEEALKIYEEVAITAGLAGSAIKGTVSALTPGQPGEPKVVELSEAENIKGKGGILPENLGDGDDLGLQTDAEKVQTALEMQADYIEPREDGVVMSGAFSGAFGTPETSVLASNTPVTTAISPQTVAPSAPAPMAADDDIINSVLGRLGTSGDTVAAGGLADRIVDFPDNEDILAGIDLDFESLRDDPFGYVAPQIIPGAEAAPVNLNPGGTNSLDGLMAQEYGASKLGNVAAGSNLNGIYETSNGAVLFAKQNKTAEQAASEVNAGSLISKFSQYGVAYNKQLGDSPVVVSEYLEPQVYKPFNPDNPKHVELAKADFAMNAWLGNWDVFGEDWDNVLVDTDPSARTLNYVDLGGALEFRAKGEKKGTAFGDTVKELDTLKDLSINPQTAKIYKEITGEQVAQQVIDIASKVTQYKNMKVLFAGNEQKMLRRLMSMLDHAYLGMISQETATSLAGYKVALKELALSEGIELKSAGVKIKIAAPSSFKSKIDIVVEKAQNYQEFNSVVMANHTGNDHITQTFLQQPLLYNVLKNPAYYKWAAEKGNKLWWSIDTQKLVVQDLPSDPKKLQEEMFGQNLLPPLLFHGVKNGPKKAIDPETGLPYLYQQWDYQKQGEGVGGGDTTAGMFLTDSATGAMKWANGGLANPVGRITGLLDQKVLPVLVTVKNPWLYDANGTLWNSQFTQQLTEKAKEAGADALLQFNLNDSVEGSQFILFDPVSNIKMPYNKDFSNHPSMLKSLGGEAAEYKTLDAFELAMLDKELENVGLKGMVNMVYFPYSKSEQLEGFFTHDKEGLYIGLATEMPTTSGFRAIFRHEVLHAMKHLGFFKTLKGENIWKVLEQEVKSRGGISEWTKANYAPQYWMEEEIAQLVELHSAGQLDLQARTRIGAAVQAVRNFFRAIANWARGLGFQTAEDALNYIYSGKLAGTMQDTANAPLMQETYSFEKEIMKAKTAIKKLGVAKPNIGNPDYFNKMVKYGWGVLQLAKKNAHIPWIQNYVERARQWQQAKTIWLEKANETASKWTNLSLPEQRSLADFLFSIERMEYRTPQEIAKGIVRKPTKQEFLDLAKKHKMTAGALAVYKQVRADFDAMLNKIEEVITKSVVKQFASNQFIMMLEVAKIQKEFALLRKRPYFPHARFGKYTIGVKDAQGKTLYVEAFETAKERDAARVEVDSKFPKSKGFIVTSSALSEEQQVYQGLPQSLLLAMKQNLNLTSAQQADLDEMIIHSAPAVSFKHHLAKRKNVAGYSEDALRAYAEYFWHGANHLARIEFGPLLEQEIANGKADVKALQGVAGADSTKRVQMNDYLQHHYNSLMNPKQDWAGLRSASFMWYLGFNIKSAVVNFTQIPMVTYSHLAANFGDVGTTKALTKNMNQMKNLFRSNASSMKGRSPEDVRQLQQAYDEGLIDESFAAELAGLAEGSNLNKSMARTRWRKLTLQFNKIGGAMFQTVEKLNRRIAFLAALDLARAAKPGNKYVEDVRLRSEVKIKELVDKGWTPEEALAYAVARDSVDQTQFNYSKFAQPRMMEGRTNAFLTFFMFTQNMFWFLQNNPGMTRYLLILLLFAGIKGIPFEDDMEGLVEGVAARLGIQLDIEREVREFTQELFGESANPDFLLRGISRQGFGLKTLGDLTGMPLPAVDLSGSIGMGSPVPVLSPTLQAVGKLLKGKDFEDTFSGYTMDSVGPTFGIPLEIVKAIAANDLAWTDPKRWESASPTAIRSLLRAYRYGTEGEERTRNDATMVEFDKNDMEHMMEIAAQAAGFTPTRVARAWDRSAMLMEAEAFWKGRKGSLYEQYFRAKSAGNRGEIAEVLKAMERYNKSVPFSQMRLSQKALDRSFKQRTTVKEKREAGLPSTKDLIPLAEEIQSLHRLD